MQKKVTTVLIILLSFLLFGCPRQPTSEELRSADHGPYPYEYEEIVKKKMVKYLVDPYSAQYHYQGSPETRYFSKAFGGETIYGWGGIVLINSKNRMGGYVGATPYNYLIRNGELVYFERSR